MDLSQLKMFKTVAEQGSIARASEILHCVPSNITNRIKLLETELGVSLSSARGAAWSSHLREKYCLSTPAKY